MSDPDRPPPQPWDSCVIGPRDMTFLQAAPYLLFAAETALHYLENHAHPPLHDCEVEKRLLREAIERTTKG